MLARSTQQVLLKSLSKPSQAAKFSACASVYPNEPQPEVLTDFPTPKTQTFIREMSENTCTLQTHFPVNLAGSLGNVVCDADGNKMLDLFTSIGTNAVGYNHPEMLALADDELMKMTVATRTGIGINPVKEMYDINHDAFMSVAPPGMDRVTASMCGTCANEAAYKVAMINYAQRKRGGPIEPPSAEELASCMNNQAPGSPDYAIMSLKSSFHGRLFGAGSSSRSKAIQKVDLPAFDWPAA